MSPNPGRDTSSRRSGVQASSRAPGTRAQTVTVQPGGAWSFRAWSNGAASVPASARTVVAASVGTFADEGCSAEDEENVADDRASQRGFDEVGQPFPQGQDSDDQLGGIAEGRIQQSADAATEVLSQFLGGTPDERRERQDGEHRCSKDQCVSFGRQQVEHECHRDEWQESEQPTRSAFGHDAAVAFDMELPVCENRSGAPHSPRPTRPSSRPQCPISPPPSPYPIASS